MKDIVKIIVFAGIFAIPFIVLNVQNDMFFPYITGKNFFFRIIVEIIFAAWIILALYDETYRPRFSWILGGFGAFLVTMFFSNLLGENPASSFWSNFERMEGYVTLVHVFLLVLVFGSVMKTEKVWYRFFITTTVAALILTFYAFAQKAGYIEHRYGGFRVDATLGNATYMAVYMLFHVAIAVFLMFKSEKFWTRFSFGLLAILFSYLLIQTATRGTTLGLLTLFFTGGVYIAYFGKAYPLARKIASYSLIALVVVVIAFISVRKTDFVQNSETLTRLANISLEAGSTRFNIWEMAFQGVKERPLLGWGQSNYNYVFNTYYEPELHNQEAWFDRVHNIVMDWLIAGGALGLTAYLSIIGAAFYYIFFRPLFMGDETFSVIERGVLIGLLSGYMVHNLVVFDNIISYIFYGIFLAYIHARVGTTISWIQRCKLDRQVIDQVIAPVVGVGILIVVYYVNVPGMQAAGDIIEAFRTDNPEVMLESFDRALSRNSFGNQEIREQMTQRIQSVIQAPQVPEEFKERALARVEEELFKQRTEKPGDARVEVFLSSFYRMSGNLDKAAEHLEIARALSPKKQIIIFEQGFTELQRKNYEAAMQFFKEAYDLSPQFLDVRTHYAMSAVYNNRMDIVDELIQTEDQKRNFSLNQSVLQALYQMKQYERLIEAFRFQIATRPEDAQLRTNLAYILNEVGKKDEAIEILKKAATDIPSFKAQADQFIAQIEGPKIEIK